MEASWNGIPYVTDADECYDDFQGALGMADPERRYSHGQCHAFAIALCMERPGWTLGTWEDDDHTMALTPDGLAVDILGPHDASEPQWFYDGHGGEYVKERDWEYIADLCGEGYSVPVVDEYTRSEARRVLAEHGL